MQIEMEKEQAPEKTKKKTSRVLLYIVLAVFLLIASGGYFVGRNSSWLTHGIISSLFKKTGTEEENGQVTYKGDEGEFSYNQGGELPEDFPKDFPIYPGAKLTSSWTAQGEETRGVSIVWETQDSPEEVSDYFKNQLELSGWKITSSFSQGGSVNYSFEKDNVSGFIGIARAEEGKTTLSLTLGVK
jgi:hypothetical protein